jgi:hypothetical protein
MRIVIILDNNIDMIGRHIRGIPPMIAHELYHMASSNDINFFANKTFDSDIIPFFGYLTDSITGIGHDKSKLERTAKQLLITSEHKMSPRSSISDVADIWLTYFMQLHGNEVDAKKSTLKILAPYLHYNLGILKPQYKEYVESTSNSMYKAYNSIGIPNADAYTLACQEIRFPSEIVCIKYQFKPSASSVSLINNINL